MPEFTVVLLGEMAIPMLAVFTVSVNLPSP
jgi:hypothetical protein